MSKQHILVVDDDPIWQEEVPQILQRLGGNMQIDTAHDYDEALNYLDEVTYDLIIVDIALSGDPLDSRNDDQRGMDLLGVIRNNQDNRNCGIVILTAFGDITRAIKALRDHNVYELVEKEKFNAQQFVEIARTALRKARLKTSEDKARQRVRLTITFDNDHLTGCELIGTDIHSMYHASEQLHFNADDLARRADNMNVFLLHSGVEVWRREAKSIGSEMYKTISKEQRVQSELISAQRHAQNPKNLWLQFSGPAIALGIPFELLHNGDEYLARMHVLTRRIIQTGPTAWRKTESFHAFVSGLLKLNRRLRILIVGANSDGSIPDAEIEAESLKSTIESDLRQLGIPHEITLYLGAQANYVQVSAALQSGRYHIFHYAGHGRFHDTLPEISGLILSDDEGPRTLTAADLNMLVRNTELQLIFLSCCLGARSDPQLGRGDFHGMLEALATADVPIAIGYRWTVADSPALYLAQNYYEALWRTFSPGDALLEARMKATMGPMGRDDETWASPVMIMQNE